MYAYVNETKIFFDIDGAGYIISDGQLKQKPVCFVLHGGPGGTHANFKPYLDQLTKTLQLVYIDNRGSGFSETGPQSSYNMENNVRDIEALRQYLGLEKIWLLGHSYGGMVAMSYAIRYQDYLNGLLLLTTSPSYRFLEKAKTFISQNGTEEQKEMADILWRGAFQSKEQLERYYEVMGPLYSRADAKAGQQFNRKQNSINRSYEAINEGFGGFLKKYDIIDQLPNIHLPTLVIAGRYDWITPVEESAVIAKQIPKSKFIIFEESSHNVLKDENSKLIKEISQFVKENSVE